MDEEDEEDDNDDGVVVGAMDDESALWTDTDKMDEMDEDEML